MANIIPSQPVEYKKQRILTTEQLAKALGTSPSNIRKNFQRNSDHFVENIDFYCLKDEELKQFLSLRVTLSHTQNTEKIRNLYLWTEKGAWLHVQFLETDEAKAAFKGLRDTYYQQKAAIEELKKVAKTKKTKKPVEPKKPVERLGPEPHFMQSHIAVPWATQVRLELKYGDDSAITEALFKFLYWMNEPMSLTRIRKECLALAKVPRDVEADTLDIMAAAGELTENKVKNELLYAVAEFRKPPDRALIPYEE